MEAHRCLDRTDRINREPPVPFGEADGLVDGILGQEKGGAFPVNGAKVTNCFSGNDR